MLQLKNIVKDYAAAGNTVHALRGVSVNFRESEFVSILGPSGCGKTTLLNIIGGLDKYTSGDLVIGGRSTRSFSDRDWDVYRNHRVGFVFQSYNLIPHQTVLGNVELALTIAGVSKAERRRRAAEALQKVGLGDQLDKRPNQLSGGQCQRVAIARALVNDPEILLADEPTGALDSVTSVQIMDLMKEIAGERLVIMVTHNPELAEKYSTRIIRLRDGNIVSDSDPYDEEEEEREETAGGKERAKMGFGAAFALSGRNLIAKKGRTIMVGIAGSIGIIGVAIVLAFSSGITGYINSMQNDMLSGYPLYVSESALDYSSLLSLTSSLFEDEDKSWHEDNKVYVNSVVETLTELGGAQITNNITQDYVDYVEDMPQEYYKAIRYSYGTSFANNIYTDYRYADEGASDSEGNPVENSRISITGIRAIYAGVLSHIEEYASYSSMISSIGTFSELPDSEEYIRSQYDVVAGEYPEQSDKSKLVLVLSADSEVTDLMLAQFGYVTSREFANYAFSLAGDDATGGYNEYFDPDQPHMNKEEPFDFSEFVGETSRKFYWYPNDAVYDYSPGVGEMMPDSYVYHAYSDEFTNAGAAEDGFEMEVACVLRPKSDVMYGSLSSGMYYTKALTSYVHERENDEKTMSVAVKNAKAMSGDGEVELKESEKYITNVTYSYYFYYDDKNDETGEIVRNIREDVTEGFGTYGSSSAASSGLGMISSMYSKEEFEQLIDNALASYGDNYELKYNAIKMMLVSAIYGTSDKVVYLSELGGCSLPSRITFYISDFDNKDMVTAYLDGWNDSRDELEQIQYTDTVGIIMEMVGMLITMITVALIVFTSISLVVSTVMIGIITFVSVVERIKEIGVIRAMGGRKRDVKNLFTAETVIIGLLAGIIGVIVTYLLSLIANLIIGHFTGIYTIAALPPWQALIMIALSVVLTLISGLLPASKAAKQDPVVALRTE